MPTNITLLKKRKKAYFENGGTLNEVTYRYATEADLPEQLHSVLAKQNYGLPLYSFREAVTPDGSWYEVCTVDDERVVANSLEPQTAAEALLHMAKGGNIFDFLKNRKRNLSRDRQFVSQQEWEKDYKRKTKGKKYKRTLEHGGEPDVDKYYTVSLYFKDEPNKIIEGYTIKDGQAIDSEDDSIFFYASEADIKKMMDPNNEDYDFVVTQYDIDVPSFNTGGSLSPEISIAKSDLLKLQEYSAKIQGIVKNTDDVEPWITSAISKVEQTVANIKHTLEAEHPQIFEHGGNLQPDGENLNSMLRHIGKYATALLHALEKEVELCDWMLHELAIAGNSIDEVYHKLDYKTNAPH